MLDDTVNDIFLNRYRLVLWIYWFCTWHVNICFSFANLKQVKSEKGRHVYSQILNREHMFRIMYWHVLHFLCLSQPVCLVTARAGVLLSQYLDYAAAVWGLVYVWLIWVIKLYAIKFYPYWYLFTHESIVYFLAPTVRALAFIFCVWQVNKSH